MKTIALSAIVCSVFLMVAPGHAGVFEISFTPAFLPKSHISISNDNGVNSLVFRFGDVRTKVEQVETYNLDQKMTAEFFRNIDELSQKRQGRKHTGRGYDGITIEGTYTRPEADPFKFKSWSPSKEYLQRDYAIIETLFKVFDALHPSNSLVEYIERLSICFEGFPFPVKIIGGSPYRIRFYGMLSVSDETELINLIKTLPTDSPLLIDMSNFEGMGTILYPCFQKLLSKNKDVKWIASGNAKRQILELGVKESDILVSDK